MASYEAIRTAYLAEIARSAGVTEHEVRAVLLKFLTPENGWLVVNIVGTAFGEEAKAVQEAWDRVQAVMSALRFVVTNDETDLRYGPTPAPSAVVHDGGEQ
jgi:hypothetical protein